MVGAAQQVEQGFFVVFAGGLHRRQAQRQLVLKGLGGKTLGQQLLARQLVDDARVLQQIAGGPARSTQQVQQALMHKRALQQQRQVALAAQQWLQPVNQAQCGQLGGSPLGQPLRGALHQAHQPGARFIAQCLHARLLTPGRNPLTQRALQVLGQSFQRGQGIGCLALRATAFASFFLWTAQQRIKLLRHALAVSIELTQKGRRGQTQRGGNPLQVFIARGQDVRLLVVQVLDAVLYTAQKRVGSRQLLRRFLRHQASTCQALQGLQRRAATQLRKLPTTHHLQQLHDELNLANATARQLDVVRPLRAATAALYGMVTNLAVQHAQGVEHAVVQIAAKNKGQHRTAQRGHQRMAHRCPRRDDAALEPGKALPFAPMQL